MESVGSPLLWAAFAAIVVSVLALDLGLFNRKAHEISTREAAAWTTVWVSLSMAFNAFVYVRFGTQKAAEFFQAWIIEEMLSVDNIFVFLVVFSYFSLPRAFQHRVLFWGILGAVVTRGVFIFLGTALTERFHWVMYLFGILLLVTALKLFRQSDEDDGLNMERNVMLRLWRRFIPTTSHYEGQRFVVRVDGRLMATPLLCVLFVIEATDVVFAIDSIPAVFGVTRDVFIVYTSNIFAVLGLRSMAFLLAGALSRFHYLKTGLAVILAFIGAKILVEPWLHIESTQSLVVVVLVLLGSSLASVLFPAPPAVAAPALERPEPFVGEDPAAADQPPAAAGDGGAAPPFTTTP